MGNVHETHAVEGKVSLSRRNETRKSVEKCCFSDSRWADNCDEPSTLDFKVESFNKFRAPRPCDREVFSAQKRGVHHFLRDRFAVLSRGRVGALRGVSCFSVNVLCR